MTRAIFPIEPFPSSLLDHRGHGHPNPVVPQRLPVHSNLPRWSRCDIPRQLTRPGVRRPSSSPFFWRRRTAGGRVASVVALGSHLLEDLRRRVVLLAPHVPVLLPHAAICGLNGSSFDGPDWPLTGDSGDKPASPICGRQPGNGPDLPSQLVCLHAAEVRPRRVVEEPIRAGLPEGADLHREQVEQGQRVLVGGECHASAPRVGPERGPVRRVDLHLEGTDAHDERGVGELGGREVAVAAVERP